MDRLLVALDVDTPAEAHRLADRLRGIVGGFKVGSRLFTSHGPSLVEQLVARGDRVFLDLKFHDIPNTVAKTCIEAARMGVWMFNLHAMGGNEMMKKAVYETGNLCDREGIARPRIIAVTVLTSSSGDALHEIGIEGSVETEVVRLVLTMRMSGASFREICTALTNAGHQPRRASAWHPMVVRSIVQRHTPNGLR